MNVVEVADSTEAGIVAARLVEVAAPSVLGVATGSAKARAIAAMLDGPAGPACPASALRSHPNVMVVAAPAALSQSATRAASGAA